MELFYRIWFKLLWLARKCSRMLTSSFLFTMDVNETDGQHWSSENLNQQSRYVMFCERRKSHSITKEHIDLWKILSGSAFLISLMSRLKVNRNRILFSNEPVSIPLLTLIFSWEREREKGLKGMQLVLHFLLCSAPLRHSIACSVIVRVERKRSISSIYRIHVENY